MMIVGIVRALKQSCYRTSFITKELHLLLYINHDGDKLINISKRQSSTKWKSIKKNMSKKQQQRQLYPSRCPCCDNIELDSMHNCVNHLSSAKHIAKIKEMFDIKDECRPNIVSMFTFPNQRQMHIEYGFKVDEILAAVADGIGQPRFDGAKEQALLIPPERNWFLEISRYFVGWNGGKSKWWKSKKMKSLNKGLKKQGMNKKERSAVLNETTAPSIAESLRRMQIGRLPPPFISPTLPIRIPVVEKSYIKLKWPHRPGIALPFALIQSKKGKLSLDGVDVITSTSFIYALAGDEKGIRDKYLLQRIGNTIAIASMRKKMSHKSYDTGILAETICCPSSRGLNFASYSISRVSIGDKTFLLSTEVDGYDMDTKEIVEVKASRSGPRIGMKELLQMMANGSSRIVKLKASEDNLSFESSTVSTREEIMNLLEDQYIYTGQRIKYMLPLVLDNQKVMNAIERPVMMSFSEDDKLPLFSPAPSGSSVIPTDFSHV